MPAVGMREEFDQLPGSRSSQSRWGRLFESVRRYTINTAAIVPAIQVEMLFDRFRNGPGVLDHLAVHIRHEERAIRGIGKLHGPEPQILRGDKFHLLFACC